MDPSRTRTQEKNFVLGPRAKFPSFSHKIWSKTQSQSRQLSARRHIIANTGLLLLHTVEDTKRKAVKPLSFHSFAVGISLETPLFSLLLTSDFCLSQNHGKDPSCQGENWNKVEAPHRRLSGSQTWKKKKTRHF